MKLTASEIHSATWKRLSEHIADRLTLLREQNDEAVSEVGTAKLRGRIAELKEILRMAEPEEKKPELQHNEFEM